MAPVSCIISHVSRLLSPVSRLLSHVSCFTSPASCLLSQVSCLTSPASCILSHVSRLTSPIWSLLSHVSCLISPVTCLLSHVSFTTVNWWRSWLGGFKSWVGYIIRQPTDRIIVSFLGVDLAFVDFVLYKKLYTVQHKKVLRAEPDSSGESKKESIVRSPLYTAGYIKLKTWYERTRASSSTLKRTRPIPFSELKLWPLRRTLSCSLISSALLYKLYSIVIISRSWRMNTTFFYRIFSYKIYVLKWFL